MVVIQARHASTLRFEGQTFATAAEAIAALIAGFNAKPAWPGIVSVREGPCLTARRAATLVGYDTQHAIDRELAQVIEI